MSDEAVEPSETDESKAWRARRAPQRRTLSESMDRLSLTKLRVIRDENDAFPWDEYPRPTTRGDCLPGGINEARPCPFVTCKHHLIFDVSPRTGAVISNFPGVEPEDWKRTCALDEVDEHGAQTLEDVADALNVTRERIRQIEMSGMHTFQHHVGADSDLLDALRDGSFLEEAHVARAQGKEASMQPLFVFGESGEGEVTSLEPVEEPVADADTIVAAVEAGLLGPPPSEHPVAPIAAAFSASVREPKARERKPFDCEENDLLRAELVRRREAAGLLQKHLAEMSGVTLGVIGAIESGNHVCSAKNARLFDAALKTGTLFQSLARAVAMKRWDEGTLHGDGGWSVRPSGRSSAPSGSDSSCTPEAAATTPPDDSRP